MRPPAGASFGRAGSRIKWLDGLRGVAAIQVILLHYTMAFLPAAALVDAISPRHAWDHWVVDTPLFFPINGLASVYLFFIMSGAALTQAFASTPLAVGYSALRRLVRLGLPMAAAVTLGYGLLSIQPTAHITAAEATGSFAWLESAAPASINLRSALHQILFEGMIFGYKNVGIVPPKSAVALGLMPIGQTYNGPLWTLHLEFVGSLLTIMLVAIRAKFTAAPRLFVWLLLSFILLKSPLILFLIGHLTASLVTRPRHRLWQLPFAVAAVATALLLSAGRTYSRVNDLYAALPPPFVYGYLDSVHFQPALAAIIGFLGVLFLPWVQTLLLTKPVQFAGRISFSLYLVHYPIMLTLACGAFNALAHSLPVDAAASLSALIGLGVSVLSAIVFNRWIDQPSIRASRWFRPRRAPVVL